MKQEQIIQVDSEPQSQMSIATPKFNKQPEPNIQIVVRTIDQIDLSRQKNVDDLNFSFQHQQQGKQTTQQQILDQICFQVQKNTTQQTSKKKKFQNAELHSSLLACSENNKPEHQDLSIKQKDSNVRIIAEQSMQDSKVASKRKKVRPYPLKYKKEKKQMKYIIKKETSKKQFDRIWQNFKEQASKKTTSSFKIVNLEKKTYNLQQYLECFRRYYKLANTVTPNTSQYMIKLYQFYTQTCLEFAIQSIQNISDFQKLRQTVQIQLKDQRLWKKYSLRALIKTHQKTNKHSWKQMINKLIALKSKK